MIASPARYSALCALVLGGLALLAAEGPEIGLLPALLLLPLVAWPAWIALAHPAAVRKVEARAVLRDGAAPWWAWVLGGALWRQILAVPVALAAAWSVGWWLLAEGWAGLGWIAAVAAVLYPLAALLVRPMRALKPYARLRPVMLLAPPTAALVLTLAWGLGMGSGTIGPGTLAARVAAEPRYEGTSALLAWAVDGMAVANGAQGWAEDRLGSAGALWRVVTTFGAFWLLGGVFAGLLLPQGEARRILCPSEADRVPAVEPMRVAVVTALLAVLTGALVSVVAEAEAWATDRQRPVALADPPGLGAPQELGLMPPLGTHPDAAPIMTAPGPPTPSALRSVVEAERIGTLACPPGTSSELEGIDRSLREVLAARRAKVEDVVRAGFDRARTRVPAFLDRYYSLTADYLRTFHLVAGDANEFLTQEMTAALEIDNIFAGFRAAALEFEAPLPARLLAVRDRLLADCGLLPADDAALRIVATAPAGLLRLAPEVKAAAFQARLTASATGVAIGGLAGVMVGKLVAKEAFGLAAEAVAKLAVGKATGGLGGAAAGAGAGALAGSVVPGVGTTVGAVLGGVVGGLAIGAATDYALIEIEEAVSRDDFERQIHAAINEAEAEVLATLAAPN